MKLSERMLARIRKHIDGIPLDAVLVRTYAGRDMLCWGAFRWTMESTIDPRRIGSTIRMTDLIRCPNWIIDRSWRDVDIMCGCKGQCKGAKK